MKRSLIAAAALLAFAGGAAAQQYPTKSITMLVPFAAGGPTDTVARVVAQSMSKPLGQTIVVENKPSAGGILAPEQVKNARPDGYTILIHHIGMATTPALYRQLRFNPLTDFEYIGLINEVPMTIIANEKVPAKDLKEFLAYLRANKDKVSYANAGIGAASHLCGMLFMSAIQLDLLTVPYKGTGPAMNDLLGGQVTFMCDQTTTTTSQIKSGKVKAYGITSAKRVASLPDLPTLQEQGLKGFECYTWNAIFAPAKTPPQVVARLNEAINKALADPALFRRLQEAGIDPTPGTTPDKVAEFVRAELAKWAPIIKASGAELD